MINRAVILIIVSRMDCKLIQWDYRKGQKKVELNMSKSFQNNIILINFFLKAERYHMSEGNQVANPPTVNALANSPDGKMIACGLGDGNVCVLKYNSSGKLEGIVDLVGKHSWSVTNL